MVGDVILVDGFGNDLSSLFAATLRGQPEVCRPLGSLITGRDQLAEEGERGDQEADHKGYQDADQHVDEPERRQLLTVDAAGRQGSFLVDHDETLVHVGYVLLEPIVEQPILPQRLQPIK